MAYLIKTNNSPFEFQEIIEVSPANGSDFTLEELQGFVGGFIEHVDLPHRQPWMIVTDEPFVRKEFMLESDINSLWLNEEGKLNSLPVNYIATQLWENVYGETDIIVGDVLLCRDEEVQ